MRNYACTSCGSTVFFANDLCVTCNHKLGYDPDTLSIIALEPVDAEPGLFLGIQKGSTATYRYCANAAHGACNWLTTEVTPEGLCKGCDLNGTIPNLAEPGNLEAWQELERAKKRLIYSVLRFGLPLDATDLGKDKLSFDFVRDAMTGHLDGVVTISIMEADAVERERRRQNFDEAYRSLLGHLRHESGHFYWNVLVDAGGRVDEFRALFGDDRQDYAEALAKHHAEGAPKDWPSRFVSAYASSHPWEDWAETWAHYIHMVDAVETAEVEGIEPRASGLSFGALWPFKSYDVYREESFESLKDRWIPLTIALNRLNRSMGHNDFYPFVIPAPAYDKLAFVHRAIRDRLT